jgi:hypothetical protein
MVTLHATIAGQQGGHYLKFGKLVFTTLRGAGHFAALDKPAEAFQMFPGSPTGLASLVHVSASQHNDSCLTDQTCAYLPLTSPEALQKRRKGEKENLHLFQPLRADQVHIGKRRNSRSSLPIYGAVIVSTHALYHARVLCLACAL